MEVRSSVSKGGVWAGWTAILGLTAAYAAAVHHSGGHLRRGLTAAVIGFTILSVHGIGAAAPDRPTGIALGLGGLAGGYTGAHLQSRLPEVVIRRLVGVVVLAIGIFYLWSGLA